MFQPRMFNVNFLQGVNLVFRFSLQKLYTLLCTFFIHLQVRLTRKQLPKSVFVNEFLISLIISPFINLRPTMSESADSEKCLDTAAPADCSDLEEEGKNKTQVLCQKCESVVLQPGIACRVKKEVCGKFDIPFVLYNIHVSSIARCRQWWRSLSIKDAS